MKVYTVGSKTSANWINNCEHTNYDDSELVLFLGGEDVNPLYYNEPPHRTTFFNILRDSKEEAIFKSATQDKKKIFGICRGFQLIHALQGYRLAQDINGHLGGHEILKHKSSPVDFPTFYAEGNHHQNPIVEGYQDITPIAIAELSSKKYDGFGNKILIPYEVEAAFYPKISALGTQYHPEWSQYNTEAVIITNLLIKSLLNV